MTKPAIIFCGGDSPGITLPEDLVSTCLIISADSGLDHALACGIKLDQLHLVIGDLDSVTTTSLSAARSAGVEIVQAPHNKDKSDLELALDAALARDITHALVVGGAGDRTDHWLENLLLLGHERYRSLAVAMVSQSSFMSVVSDETSIVGQPGDLVSLLPIAGPARGVSTDGLEYPLVEEDLEPGTSRGLSNTFTAPSATIRVSSGTLLVIQPSPIDSSNPHFFDPAIRNFFDLGGNAK